MNLYLIRHGLAIEAGSPGYEDDTLRPLTDKGRRKMRAIAKGLHSLGVGFDAILSSPYVRTKETAKIVGDVFEARKKIAFSENLVPSGDGDKLITEINEKYMVDSLAIVGHEPALSSLVGLLAGNNSRIDLTLKKGGVCLLVAEDLQHERRASLEWLLPPSILTDLGDQ